MLVQDTPIYCSKTDANNDSKIERKKKRYANCFYSCEKKIFYKPHAGIVKIHFHVNKG